MISEKGDTKKKYEKKIFFVKKIASQMADDEAITLQIRDLLYRNRIRPNIILTMKQVYVDLLFTKSIRDHP